MEDVDRGDPRAAAQMENVDPVDEGLSAITIRPVSPRAAAQMEDVDRGDPRAAAQMENVDPGDEGLDLEITGIGGDGHDLEEEPDFTQEAQDRGSFTDAYKIPKRILPEFTFLQSVLLGYQSLGVVYGDIGTSPLDVFSSITLDNPGEKDILGTGLVKNVFIVMHANDHGEGGTFAIYSLLRQHIKFSEKAIVATTKLDSDVNLRFHSKSRAHPKMQKFLEESTVAQNVLTYTALAGTCLLIGDGALTPAISVLSAVQGIQTRSSKITQDHVVILSVVILLILFLLQSFGTSKVTFAFSPIMLLWFACTAGIGVYNIIKFYPPVLKALSPHYIYYFFERNPKNGWESLGEIILCITGAEAMFADLGHFNMLGIQLAFSALVYPALILAYAGEAAFVIKNPDKLRTALYSSVPEPLFWVWPVFVVSTSAAVVASQSLISASFSIVRQWSLLAASPE